MERQSVSSEYCLIIWFISSLGGHLYVSWLSLSIVPDLTGIQSIILTPLFSLSSYLPFLSKYVNQVFGNTVFLKESINEKGPKHSVRTLRTCIYHHNGNIASVSSIIAVLHEILHARISKKERPVLMHDTSISIENYRHIIVLYNIEEYYHNFITTCK